MFVPHGSLNTPGYAAEFHSPDRFQTALPRHDPRVALLSRTTGPRLRFEQRSAIAQASGRRVLRARPARWRGRRRKGDLTPGAESDA